MSTWGRENESTSSSSTTSSAPSRRREPEIDVFAVRNRIVDKIMAKKQREQEESQRGRDTSATRRKSRAPLTDLAQSNDEMELTQAASTSTDARNLNWTMESSRRKNKVYSSTPLPGRSDTQRKHSPRPDLAPSPRKTPVKSRTAETSMIPEVESEEELPPPPPLPTPKAPSQKHNERGRPRKEAATKSTRPLRAKPVREPSPEVEPLAFQDSSHEGSPAGPQPDSDQDGDEQSAEPSRVSTRQTSRDSPPKSPKKTSTDRSRTAGPRSPAKLTKETPAKLTKETPAKLTKETPAKPSKKLPAKPSKKTPARHSKRTASIPAQQAPGELPEEEPGPSTSAADGTSRGRSSASSSRRKAPPRRASPSTRTRNLFNEVRRLQNEPGFLIPRLPFMRLVREIVTGVAVSGSNFRFTVDAMEALQTATEYYLTSVFTDAAALANHAKRVTVMPKDLDLLRKLRVVDI